MRIDPTLGTTLGLTLSVPSAARPPTCWALAMCKATCWAQPWSGTMNRPGHRGWVYHLAVASSVRRQGLGRDFMRVCEE